LRVAVHGLTEGRQIIELCLIELGAVPAITFLEILVLVAPVQTPLIDREPSAHTFLAPREPSTVSDEVVVDVRAETPSQQLVIVKREVPDEEPVGPSIETVDIEQAVIIGARE
jgi:hypothetical protein